MNPNRPPILVTGAHRTGTTWVGKMLTASGEAGYISEPLNVLHRPGVLRVPVPHWYNYICAENGSLYLAGLQETAGFRYHLGREIESLRSAKDVGRMGRDAFTFCQGRLRRQRALLKDPFAIFSIPWFIDQFDSPVVVTVRHPAAFASSLVKLHWPFQLQDLLAQPLLMRDWLEPYRQEMTALLASPDDILAVGSLLWSMVYSSVFEMQLTCPANRLKIVRQEDLALDPLNGFRELCQFVGLAFTPAVEQVIQESSSSENPQELQHTHSTRLDSRASLENWKRRLSQEQIALVRRYTEAAAKRYYPDLAWD